MSRSLLDKGGGQRWQALRTRVIRRDGGRCVNCGSTELLQVDHVIERVDGGDDRIDNLQTLCQPCHKAKTSTNRRRRAAAQPKPSITAQGSVVQVSGPPCAGKSTRLRELQQDGYRILDDWDYHQRNGAAGRDQIPGPQWKAWYVHLDRSIAANPPTGKLAYIRGNPEPLHPGVQVQLIDPGQDECHARADADGRPEATHEWIDDWYRRHGARTAARSMPRAATPGPHLPFMSEWERKGSEIQTPFAENPRMPGPDDGIPLLFPPPHPEAADSLGDLAVTMMEARMQADPRGRVKTLRWWQWVILQRLLERRPDGRWCWPVAFVSGPRQQGKSELLCELACWRCGSPALFGDGLPQIAGHSANTVAVSRLMQSHRWQWAEGLDLTVRRQLGDSQIVWPDGSTWQTMAPENMYSRALDLVLADEAWSWEDGNFWQATFPTMAERPASQAVLFSTAHDDAKTLVPTLLDSPLVATMLWGAPADADRRDPAVWRAATPHWSVHRLEAMRMAADQPSFATQWLNTWPRMATGETWYDKAAWSAARVIGLHVPDRPTVAAVEDELGGSGASVAYAWHDDDGIVCATAFRVADLPAAWRYAAAADRVLAGITLTKEPDAKRARARPAGQRETATALPELRRLLPDGLRWDGDDLADQMPTVRVRETPGGITVQRGSPSALVRSMAWAVQDLRTRQDPVLV